MYSISYALRQELPFHSHSALRKKTPLCGMQLQNLTVKALWLFTPTAKGGVGMTFDPNMLQQMTPNQFGGFINQQVQQDYSQYQFFTSDSEY